MRAEKASLEKDRDVDVLRAKKLKIDLAKVEKVGIQLQKELEQKDAFCEAEKDRVTKELHEAYNGMFPDRAGNEPSRAEL